MKNLLTYLADVGLWLLLGAISVSAQPLFEPAVNYPVGDGPYSIFAIDLDNDGDNDLAVANLFDGDVSVLLNNGDGTYQTALDYGAGDGPRSVFSADFDGDGYNDLVLTGSWSHNVSILFNNGDGTFQVPVNYPTGLNPWCPFAADLDGDSDNDIVLVNESSNSVSVFIVSSNGTLETRVDYNVGTAPHSVFAIDLDGDTDYDLAVGNSGSNNVSVLLNNGDGTFQSVVNYGTANYPNSIFSADFDFDGDNDLAVSNVGSGNVSILMNNGDGTFQPAVNYTAGTANYSIYGADFSLDGYVDLVVSNANSNVASILVNNGNGTFQAAITYAVGTGPHSIFAADLNSDGVKDIAVANTDSDDISVLINITEQEFYTIPEVYDNMAALEGQEVKVYGQYVSPGDSKLVTLYAAYLLDQLMPINSIMFLEGTLPDSNYWYGGTMIVTGVVTSVPEPYPVYGPDTLEITITATSYEYLVESVPFPKKLPIDKKESIEKRQFEKLNIIDCDSCKFAILVSGGGKGGNNKPTYWENIENLYKYKRDSAGYCEENIYVFYFDGTSGNEDEIPSDQVRPCTQSGIDSAHNEIADKIAECDTMGEKSTVQKMFTNHGDSLGRVVLLGEERLDSLELVVMQQKLIDACCSYLYDEFLTCFGGAMVNGLMALDDKGKTEIHANSAAPADNVGASPSEGGHVYLNTKIDSLEDGKDYEDAVRDAEKAYLDWLRNIVIPWFDNDIAREEAKRDSLPEGSKKREEMTKQINEKKDIVAKLRDQTQNDGCPSWVRYQFKEYCEWKKIVAPEGGQFKFTFKGSGGCGNVTVYEEQPDGTKKRVKTWNWNIPGSAGYSEGNEERVINADSTSTGIFWIHNDNWEFTVTVESFGEQLLPESQSNQGEFAGFSAGANDSSSAEFGSIVAGSYVTTGTDEEGFNLSNIPAILGTDGVGIYTAQFSALASNLWWDSMEVYIDVLNVSQPGVLQVECPTASVPVTQVLIDSPGEYLVYLGLLEAPIPAELTFDASGAGKSVKEAVTIGVDLEWDSWGLRTLVPTFTSCCIGIRGNIDYLGGEPGIDIADLVYFVDYSFGSPPGPEPVCFDEADVDASGELNIGDIVYLVEYMFGDPPGPAPLACP